MGRLFWIGIMLLAFAIQIVIGQWINTFDKGFFNVPRIAQLIFFWGVYSFCVKKALDAERWL